MDVDEFSTALIPSDLDILRESDLKAIKTLGNGNCMFNALSILLKGNQTLAPQLRKECAWELCNHKLDYFQHIHLQKCSEKMGVPIATLHHYFLADDALKFQDPEKSFDHEVRSTFQTKRWASLLHVLGLSTVLQQTITSVFPDVPVAHRCLVHCVIEPIRQDSSKFSLSNRPLIILWSRDGTFDNTPGAMYCPNHVVPLINLDNLADCGKNKATKRKISQPPIKQAKISSFFTSPPIPKTSQQASRTPHITEVHPPLQDLCDAPPATSDSHTVPEHCISFSLESIDGNITQPDDSQALSLLTPVGACKPQPHQSVPSVSHQSVPSVSHQSVPSVSHQSVPTVSHQSIPSVSHQSVPSVSHQSVPSVSHQSVPSVAHQSVPSVSHQSVPSVPHQSVPSVPTAASPITDSSVTSSVPRTLNSWLAQFKWLEFDSNACLLKCTLCISAAKDNVFSRGKPASISKKDDLTKHSNSIDHRNAQAVPSLRANFSRSKSNAYSSVKGAVVAQLATVLTQAKEAIPTVKNSSLIKLQIFNGVTSLKQLLPDCDDGQKHYVHNESIDEFYGVIRDMTKNNLKEDREASPYQMYSLELDEATDVSNKSVLLTFLRLFTAKHVLRESFLGVQELQTADAQGIFTAARSILDDNQLPIEDMMGLATDGASVMTGVHTGVATRFKDLAPRLTTIHCMAHRLQLVSEKAANCVPYIPKYIGILNQFAKSLKYSPKLQRILETSKEMLGTKSNKIKQVFFTRWLSFNDSVHALAGCIGPVISALQAAAVDRGVAGRAVLHGVMDQIATIKFLLMTHFLADVVGILGILSKVLQESGLTYTSAKMHIDASVTAIQALSTHPGPYMQQITAAIPDTPHPTGYFQFQGHDFKDKETQRQKFKEAADHFIEEVVSRLTVTFPDTNIRGNFQVLSPKELKFMSTEEAQAKVERLCEHYGVEKAPALVEWSILSPVLRNPRNADKDISQCLEHTLNPTTHPNMSALAAIGVTLPTTSVNCERGISAYNDIKTNGRNMLTVKHAQDLMWIYLEAPTLEEFDFDKAFDIWYSKKKRMGFSSMVKDAVQQMK